MITRRSPRTLLLALIAAVAALVTGLFGVAAPASAASDVSVTVSAAQSKAVKLVSAVSDRSTPVFTVGALPAAHASIYVGARVRVSGKASYMLQARVKWSGEMTVSVKRRDTTGTSTDIVVAVPVAVKAAKADQILVDLTASGSSPVTLTGTVKNLRTGLKHDVTVTDRASNRVTTKAGTDAWVYGSSNATSPQTVRVANYVAPATPAPTQPAPTQPATPTTPVQSGAGVPAGTKLTLHEGDLLITKPNTVVRNLEIRGFVRVNAPGAVIENSKILGRKTTTSVAIVSNYNNGNTFTIRNSEIYAATPSPYLNGIMGHNFTADRVWVHGVVDSVRITGSNVTISNSLLEKNLHYAVDPTQGNKPSHDDSIQIQGGSNIKITGNRISGAFNAAIQVTQGLGKVSQVAISGNRLDGGGCTVNIAETGGSAIKGISLTSNTFGQTRRVAGCGVVAPTTSYPQMTANLWESTGKAVAIVRGK